MINWFRVYFTVELCNGLTLKFTATVNLYYSSSARRFFQFHCKGGLRISRRLLLRLWWSRLCYRYDEFALKITPKSGLRNPILGRIDFRKRFTCPSLLESALFLSPSQILIMISWVSVFLGSPGFQPRRWQIFCT